MKNMSGQIPIVRHFIACEQLQISPEGRYSLFNLIHAIHPIEGATYPRIHPEIVLFALLTDGNGEHEFYVEVIYWSDGEQQSTWKTKIVKLDLGNNPLHVHGWPIRLKNVLFSQPGQYDFVLWCDGSEIARETILLRKTS